MQATATALRHQPCSMCARSTPGRGLFRSKRSGCYHPNVTTILAFLLVLGVLIFVHELGHFLVARWYGVRVLTFSLGFGPKLLKINRGGTEYCISAVPL